MIFEYHKSKLSPHLQRIYEQIVSNLALMRSPIDCDKVSGGELGELYRAIFYDHVELFFITHAPKFSSSFSFFGSRTSLLIDYIFSSAESHRIKTKMEQVASDISNQVKGLTEIEKERRILDYVIKNVNYEIDNRYNQNAGTVFYQNKGQCSGISKAVKYLCDFVGIECIVVEGSAKDVTSGTNGPHSWNIVKIDGKYTHLDATFSIGYNPRRTPPFNYKFFNCSDEEFSVDHFWDRTKYPICQAVKLKGDGLRAKATDFVSKLFKTETEDRKPSETSAYRRPSETGSSYRKPSETGSSYRKPSETASSYRRPAVSDGRKAEEKSSKPNPFALNPAPKPKPFPRNLSSTKTGGGAVADKKTVGTAKSTFADKKTASTGSFIYSYDEFKRQMGEVFTKKQSKFTFTSKIKEPDSQTLLNKLLDLAVRVATEKNVSCSINISVNGENVVVNLDWGAK